MTSLFRLRPYKAIMDRAACKMVGHLFVGMGARVVGTPEAPAGYIMVFSQRGAVLLVELECTV